MTKVSIIVPLYNSYNYLSICLDSLINQTYKDIEIIVVDDKSTDKSVSLLRKYERENKNIKIICGKKNQGLSHARNEGIKVAKGDYVFFIDSDDFIDKTGIATLVALAKKYNAEVVDMERVFWYKRKNKILTFTENKKLKEDLVLDSIRKDNRSLTLPRYATGKLYKRDIIDTVQFDENLRCYEDTLFNHQIKNLFNKYVYAKDVFYHYFQRPSSLINTFGSNHLVYEYACRKIRETYEESNYYELPIKKIVDNLLINDIFVIVAIKIPMMKISTAEKKKYAHLFFDLINNLHISNNRVIFKISFFLLRNNAFRTIYYGLVKRINLIDISFRVINIFNHYKIKDKRLINRVLKTYKQLQ